MPGESSALTAESGPIRLQFGDQPPSLQAGLPEIPAFGRVELRVANEFGHRRNKLPHTPERIFYKGLTKFLVIEEGQAFPVGLAGWAKRAYEEALSSDGLQ